MNRITICLFSIAEDIDFRLLFHIKDANVEDVVRQSTDDQAVKEEDRRNADDGPKPSARAITERFVKLRQLAGIKVSVTSSRTPGRGRARVSKYTTPQKRKNKAYSSEESDGDEHLTENESPTKKQSVQRNGGSRGRGSARGGRGGRGGRHNASSPAVRVKSEYPLPELPIDPLDAGDTFERDAADAAEIRHTSQQNPFAGFANGGMNSGMSGGMNGGFQGFGPSTGHSLLNGFGMSNGATFNNGFTSPGMALDDPFTASNHPSHGFANTIGTMQAFTNGMQAAAAGDAHGPLDTNVGRGRSNRTASAQASEGVAAVLRRQKDADVADGERSSAEDSQASEYHDLEGDYI
ncbi:uncharacterized protein N0V89_008396 [Didymosphaeria variabile]|uniref:Uncharacterized protein n=1 Tax=Didymosphaeria variabile TaxID=1932322 RepID=A0A9W9C8S6_9PLEO|nr:uncharacterized protein N0V89_008396 [Didymosphaeria variabile]KAJ4349778.1 hypothetical protein N0V89_008396 [Didymosphaeria variabile]